MKSRAQEKGKGKKRSYSDLSISLAAQTLNTGCRSADPLPRPAPEHCIHLTALRLSRLFQHQLGAGPTHLALPGSPIRCHHRPATFTFASQGSRRELAKGAPHTPSTLFSRSHPSIAQPGALHSDFASTFSGVPGRNASYVVFLTPGTHRRPTVAP